jgi:type IV secretory pathway TrbD component
MQNIQWIFLSELVLIWGSVILGFAAHWRIPLSPWIAAPIGLALWIFGFIFTLHLRKELKEVREKRVRPVRRRGYPMVEARAAMHFGVALGFRSWPTLGVAIACTAVNLWLAVSFRRKLRERISARGRWPR